MTTYSLDGFGIQFSSDASSALSVQAATLDLVVNDDRGFFRYQGLGNGRTFLPEIAITSSGIYNVDVNGAQFNTLSWQFGLEFGLGQATWSGGTTYLLTVTTPGTATDFQFVYRIGGAPLPDFSTPAQVTAWLDDVRFLGPAGGDFAPGDPIVLATMPIAASTEDDLILVRSHPSTDREIDGGEGNDTIVVLTDSGSGNILVASPGSDRYDLSLVGDQADTTLDYSALRQGITAMLDGPGNTGVIRGSGTDTYVGLASALDGQRLALMATDSADVIELATDGAAAINLATYDGMDRITLDLGEDGRATVASGAGSDSVTISLGAGAELTLVVQDRSRETGAGAIHADLSTGIVQDGTGGEDTISLTDDGIVTLLDGLGDDTLIGSARDEVFSISRGDDSIDGGAGWDVLDYSSYVSSYFDPGSGDTTTVTRSIKDLVVDLAAGTASGTFVPLDGEDAGDVTDTGIIAGIEEVRGSDRYGDRLIGDGQANRLIGNAGDDTLEGGGGNDTLDGGADRDSLDGGAGSDLLTGGTGSDTLNGGNGDDTLDGGAGADRFDGGAGIDTLRYADATGRVIVDLQGPVEGSVLTFFTGGLAEGDTFHHIENISGSRFADNLRGDSGVNILEGGNASDRLYGRAGNDILIGGAGVDALYGNLGADMMTGGTGQTDRFIYFQMSESGVGSGNRDVIADFEPGLDRIEISRFDADATLGGKQAFDWIGDAAFSGTAGELGYRYDDGLTIVQADVDGDGMADFEIALGADLVLSAEDFLI
ncbi:calcium-binding protein [Salipiger sp.]|uniref:calcium-binding protein n=1 Tax=Salipiger sp. TaxID=2078585 RepID=UPI003A974CDA